MILLDFLLSLFTSTKSKARREAQCEFDKLMNEIRFAGTIPEIYTLQDKVLDYQNTWSAIIDHETLVLFTGSLHKFLNTKEAKVQAERNQRYSKTLYN